MRIGGWHGVAASGALCLLLVTGSADGASLPPAQEAPSASEPAEQPAADTDAPGASVRALPTASVVERSRVLHRIELSNPAYPAREARILASPDDWAALWRQLTAGRTPEPPVPTVDFDQYWVIAVSMGTQRSGGYSIQITRLIETPDALRVDVRESEPEGCPTTMALTHPADIVFTERTHKPVVFHVERTVYVCTPRAGDSETPAASSPRVPPP